MNEGQDDIGGLAEPNSHPRCRQYNAVQIHKKNSQDVQNILGNKPEIRYPKDGHVGEA
jgi:hypothetical protein